MLPTLQRICYRIYRRLTGQNSVVPPKQLEDYKFTASDMELVNYSTLLKVRLIQMAL
jgi:hypothetical protein